MAVNVNADLDKIETVTSKKKKMRKAPLSMEDAAALTDGFPDPAAITFTAPVCPVWLGRNNQKLAGISTW